ncbi:MAG: family 16 glycosylhydrolase, partial [Planctomycetota bacterium]|nr:family 16 glycosylhydrolase [Planctomycetota bacterium]
EWTPDAIVWFVDGKETHRFGRVSAQREKIPDKPMYLILNLAVGGFWPGPPGEATVWPSTMEVDSVRIYRLADEEG